MTLQEMVRHLIESEGWTQTRIASEAGVTQPIVHRAFNGVDIHYSNGRKLEQLFHRIVSEARIVRTKTDQ
ncbi:MAG: hypothetical protein CMH98_19015 [Oceanospirillaceae bacterium]|nr:hypothetical protein [Oceanospirillaceae bacterium]